MRINWKIKKKRGNHRPTLSYTIILEEYEMELAVDAVNIESAIPRINDPHQSHCRPDSNEREHGWEPVGYHYISVPYFKTGSSTGFIRLPFRESDHYPEVEESFSMLRDAYEEVVNDAYAWEPIDREGELDISEETRKNIVAGVTSQKLLSLYPVGDHSFVTSLPE